MKKFNLLIASTPMQIINGIEAINYFNLDNTILVLRLRKRSNNKNIDQLESISKLYNWKKIIRVNETLSKRRFFVYLNAVKEIKKNEYNYVFFGVNSKICRLIIANTKKNHLYLIDDGTATINIYKNILQKNRLNKYNRFIFKNIRFLLFGLKMQIKDKVNLFTYFNLEKDINFKIIKNELTYFKDEIEKKAKTKTKTEDCTIFLGQPLIDAKFMTKENFIRYINFLISIETKKIKYIPHRFEKTQHLKQLVSDKFEICEIDEPIELHLIYKNIYPTKIISFCTTAIFILDKMYPATEFQHIIISKNDLLKSQEDFSNTYKSLADETSSKALFINKKFNGLQAKL